MITSAATALLCFTIAIAAPEASVHGRSRTTVVVGSQPLYSVSRGALELRRFAPIVEELTISATPGVEGLRITVDAWTAIDAGDRMLADRAIADLTLAMIEWRASHFELRAGRLFLFTDAGRALHLDGGAFSVRGRPGPFRLEAGAWFGAPVSTRYGDEPLRDTYPSAASDPLFFAPGGSDWSRPGDIAFGVRAGGAVLDVVELGLGYAQERDLDEIDREAITGRFRLEPVRSLVLDGFGSFDLYAAAMEDAELSLSYWWTEQLRAGVYGRTRVPGLTLPSTSIFSVFAGEKHAAAGIEGDFFVWNAMRVSLSAELRRTELEDGSDSSLGYRWTASARNRLIFWPGARSAVSYERLAEPWFGHYDYLRVSLDLPLSEMFSVAPDAGVFLVQRPGGELRYAGRVGLAGTMNLARQVVFVLAGRATQDERGGNELALIGRIEWNVEHTF